MPCIGLEIDENENDLTGFSTQAKQKLIEEVQNFTLDVIIETRRLEGFDNTTGNSPEITSSMVKEASSIVKRPYRIKKPGYKTILIRASAIFLPFVTSLLFDKSELQNPIYLIFIAILFGLSIFTIILSFVRENWDE